MTAFWYTGLLLLAAAGADDPAERGAIDHAIASLNDPQQRAGAFSRDSEPGIDLDRLVDLHSPAGAADPRPWRGVIGIDETWTGLTTPRIVLGRIWLLTPMAAVAEGDSTVDGAMWLRRRVPLRFVLRKEEGVWRIVSIYAVPIYPVAIYPLER
jgi:hypothetical protein